MNAVSLDIYSFLMKKDIKFIRYCHKPYISIEKWRNTIKKWNNEIIIPDINYYYNTIKNTYAIYISKEINTDAFFRNESVHKYKLIDDKNEQTKLSEILRCSGKDLSPLALIFDKESKCCIYTDNNTFLNDNMLCFSPCSDTSSVILSTNDFFNVFLPESGHTIKLI